MESNLIICMYPCQYSDRNNKPNIIKQLQHVAFPHLAELNIHGNEISSVEGLSRIFMPQLETLIISKIEDRIGFNHMIGMRDLRKSHWPDLKFLCFSKTQMI